MAVANLPGNIIGRPPGPPPHERYFKQKSKPRNTHQAILRLLNYLSRKKLVLGLVFLCAAVTTLISIVGTRLNGYTVDNFIKTGDIRGLGSICLVMLAIYGVNVFSTYAQNILMISTAQKTAADIRRDLFANLQKLPLRYFDTHSSGDLMSRLTNDVDNINLVLSQGVVQLFSGIVMIVGMLIAMLLLSPLLTLIALATTPLMFIGTRFIAGKTQPYFTAQQQELGQLNGFIEETLSGQKVVKLFSHEQKAQQEFAAINQRLTQSAAMAQGLSGVMGPLSNTTNNLTYLVIAVCGGVFIVKGMNMTAGVVFSFLLYMRNFTRPINEILSLLNTVQAALAGAERVFEVIDEEKEHDRPDAQVISRICGDISIDHVDFSYVSDKSVLKDAVLSARKGQTVAIVGPTGAGKTTIINLLTKFYDFDRGRIWIDDQEIHQITSRSLRENISVVLQDPFLFSETVRENIRYGRLSATDAEIEEAAQKAQAHEFILQLPQGYDTVLTDNGGKLSEGQRQLLSIARAIIAQSSVLILDEATSSIDTRTEVMIQNALLTLMQGKTCFVIAHRLSTIKNADKIVVIDGGRVVETGTHSELIARRGFYASLYNSQFTTGMAL